MINTDISMSYESLFESNDFVDCYFSQENQGLPIGPIPPPSPFLSLICLLSELAFVHREYLMKSIFQLSRHNKK